MQDNYLKNIREKGWQQMNETLDREMPQRRFPVGIFPLLMIGVLLLLGAITGILLWPDDIPDNPEEQKSIATSPAITDVPTSNEIPATTAEVQTNISSPADPDREEQDYPHSFAIANTSSEYSRKISNEFSRKEVELAYGEEAQNSIAYNSISSIPDKNRTGFSTISPLSSSGVSLVTHSLNPVSAPQVQIKQKRTGPFAFVLEGSMGGPENFLSAEAGIEFRKPFNRRWSIGLNGGYGYRHYTSDVNHDPVYTKTELVTGSEYQRSSLDLSYSLSSLQYIYLRPLIRYSLHPHFNIFAGPGLKHITEDNVGASEHYLVDPNNNIQEIDIETKSFRGKIFWSGVAGVEYRVCRRLALSAGAEYEFASPETVGHFEETAFEAFPGVSISEEKVKSYSVSGSIGIRLFF